MRVPEPEIGTIIEKYLSLGIPDPLISHDTTSDRHLMQMLDVIESRIPEMNCDVIPTSFDPNDSEMRAFPRPLGWRWSSAEDAIKSFGSRGIMMRLPLFWQVEPALFAAGQSVGAPIFVNDQDNMPVGAAAIKTANIDTVVTDSADALRFSSYLSGSKALFPSSWLIVHTIEQDAWTIPAPVRERDIGVFQEVHLFPGLPLWEQCAALAETKDAVFHVSDAFVADAEGDRMYITSTADEPFPLYRYEVRHPLRETGTCVCGKVIFQHD